MSSTQIKNRGVVKVNRYLGVSAFLMLILPGCNSQSNSGGSTDFADESSAVTYSATSALPIPTNSATAVCNEADLQIQSVTGGNEIVIEQCEAQDDNNGGQVFVLRLNDYTEWTTLISTSEFKTVMFSIPLGLLAYSFAGADVLPTEFSAVLLVFSDLNQTVYEINPKDLAQVLRAKTEGEANAALTELSTKIKITSLGG